MKHLLLYFVVITLYISCSTEPHETNASPAKALDLNEENTHTSDSAKKIDSASHAQQDHIHSKKVFEPSKTKSDIIPNKTKPHQMPLPGGVPDKHFLDSIKATKQRN